MSLRRPEASAKSTVQDQPSGIYHAERWPVPDTSSDAGGDLVEPPSPAPGDNAAARPGPHPPRDEADGASGGAPAPLASALPPVGARVLAFVAIVVAGACGGLIGWAVTDLQCQGGCTAIAGSGALVGAVIGAGGVAIVAVLVLRAMAEWRTIQHTGDPTAGHRSQRRS